MNLPRPNKKEFLFFCQQICLEKGFDYEGLSFALEAKFDSWDDNGWRDGFNKPIKNWKTKIRNVMPFLKAMKVKNDNDFPAFWNYDYALKLSREDGHKLTLYYTHLRELGYKKVSPTHWERVRN